MFDVALPHSKGKKNYLTLYKSMKKLLILNGPNLNLLGKREPGVYGNQSFEDYFETLKNLFPETELIYFQSNHEGALIDKIHETGFSFDGIIINAGGYTHTSVALADALSAVITPAVEVHISNIHAREPFRHHSYLTSRCKGMICGLGLKGYEMAIRYFVS
ncbi:3-dehydroquinate dehydratase [Dyadobacter sediminis]|nr:3-dehydroquinate dehydratase [Dyadobacter sediminis]